MHSLVVLLAGLTFAGSCNLPRPFSKREKTFSFDSSNADFHTVLCCSKGQALNYPGYFVALTKIPIGNANSSRIGNLLCKSAKSQGRTKFAANLSVFTVSLSMA